MIDDDVHARWRVGADLWSPRRAPLTPPALAFRVEPQHVVHAPPRPPRRRTLQDALRPTDAKQSARAARSLLEFLDAQERLSQTPSRTRRRTLADRQRDDRVWLDSNTYAAWSIDGDLVAVVDRDPAQSRWCPRITRLSDEQRRVLFSVDVFIPTVLALYRVDDLDHGPVTRFIPHYDLAAAHQAARRREEAAIATQVEDRPLASPTVATPKGSTQRLKKSRHHPEGNFVLIAPPPPDSGLPDFAVIQPLAPPRRAFETRRQAERAAKRILRSGHTSIEFTPARVLGAVEAEPVFRKDIELPRSRAERLELIRREPRIVLPDLRAAWLPRYIQNEDGEWVQQEFKNRRTVRTRHHEKLLADLGEVAEEVADLFEAAELRERLDLPTHDLVPELEAASRVALRAQRRLPEAWLRGVGLDRDAIAPDWRDLAGRRCARPDEQGHWLRAPCEFGQRHPDGLRSRIVELRIDDLAGLIEVAGWRPTLWLVKGSTAAAPQWVLPVTTAPCWRPCATTRGANVGRDVPLPALVVPPGGATAAGSKERQGADHRPLAGRECPR